MLCKKKASLLLAGSRVPLPSLFFYEKNGLDKKAVICKRTQQLIMQSDYFVT